MKEYEIRLGRPREIDVNSIIKEFKEHGFNVTEEAIMHNFEAWRADFKSGYRDEENGCHLFSACGCNDFKLWASELEPDAKWQTTYFC